ncbi:MAG: hypothetical protein MJ050_08510 [Phascolarctobacterium sp.]|nr:hypothetical protein [Phascolarctobacterium sp.]
MNFKKIALCAAALLSVTASCFAIESGVYIRMEGDHLFRVTVLSHDGYLKDSAEPTHMEFIAMENSVDECYASVLIPTGAKSYATTSGLITDFNDEKGRFVSGYLKGKPVGYDRMGVKEGDFAIKDLGKGKLKIEYAAGYVRGFGFDGIYKKEETFASAPPVMALHALEAVAKRTGYLAIDDIKYEYRVLDKSDGSGYKIQAFQPGNPEPAQFEVGVMLHDFDFMWNDKPISLFKAIREAKG